MATLEFESGEKAGRSHVLEGETTMGRVAACTLRIQDDQASRKHCRIEPGEEGGFWLTDLDSSNGTFLNEIPVKKRFRLCSGDRIRIGSTRILFRDEKQEKAPGTEVEGYRILEASHRFPEGTIYLAEQTSAGRPTLLKLFHDDFPDLNRELEELARSHAGRAHPSLLPILETGRAEERPFVAYAVPAGTLLSEREAGPDPEFARRVGASLAGALLFWSGQDFGGLEPRMIFATRDGAVQLWEPGRLERVRDALSDSAEAVRLARYSCFPESESNPALYGLGVVLHELATGIPPFEAGTLEKLRKRQAGGTLPPNLATLDPKLAEIVEELLSPEAAGTGLASLRRRLEKLATEEVTSARPETSEDQLFAHLKAEPATPDPSSSARFSTKEEDRKRRFHSSGEDLEGSPGQEEAASDSEEESGRRRRSRVDSDVRRGIRALEFLLYCVICVLLFMTGSVVTTILLRLASQG